MMHGQPIIKMYNWSASCLDHFTRGERFHGTSTNSFEEGKFFWLLPGIQPRFTGTPVRSHVTTASTFHILSFYNRKCRSCWLHGQRNQTLYSYTNLLKFLKLDLQKETNRTEINVTIHNNNNNNNNNFTTTTTITTTTTTTTNYNWVVTQWQ